MKPVHGWALFALVSIGVVCWMVFSARHSAAPPEYVALELARADAATTGSCYSLATVLRANGVDVASSHQKILWTMRVPGEWHLRMQRRRAWREFWFVREGDFVVPFQYTTSDDNDRTRLRGAVDTLLAAATNLPRVARCAAGR
jgi:hypothetical protein